MSAPIASSSRHPSSSYPPPQHLSSSSPSKQPPRTPKSLKPSSKGKEREIASKIPLPLSPVATGSDQPVKKGKRAKKGEARLVNHSPVTTDDEEGEERDEWECEGLVAEGGVAVPILFSEDGRFYFKANNTRISIHSLASSSHPLIATLPQSNISNQASGHSHPITSLSLHPSNPLLLISSSMDGTLIIWSWSDERMIKQIDLGWDYEYLIGGKDVKRAMVDHRKERMMIDGGEKGKGKNVESGAAVGKRYATGMGRGVGLCRVGKENGKPYAYAVLVPRKAKRGQPSMPKSKIIVRIPLRQIPLPDSSTELSDRNRIARLNMEVLGQTTVPITRLSVSPRGTYLMALSGISGYIRKLSVGAKGKARPADGMDVDNQNDLESASAWISFSTNTKFTVGEWCPVDGLGLPDFLRNNEEEWFATGEYVGVIKLWYGLEEAFKAAPMISNKTKNVNKNDLTTIPQTNLPNTRLHWHSHAVSSLIFHPSGTQLLSGGEENVLVKWQLDKLSKSFVPRLGSGGIASIGIKPTGPTGSEEQVWIKSNDGTIKTVGSATGTTLSIGKDVRTDRGYKVDSKKPYPMGYHIPTGSYVLPSSHPSVIQFYQPATSTVLFELEVIPTNRVSRRDKEELKPVRVESVCFSPVGEDGIVHWLATSESREGGGNDGGGKTKAIKLWEWRDNKYILNTHFTKHHNLSNVTSIHFAPLAPSSNKSDAVFLSTAEDGTAKICTVRKAFSDISGDKDANLQSQKFTLFWSLRSTINYRSLPITSSSFSRDNSLLALSHGASSVISLWDTTTTALLRVLECGVAGAEKVAFTGGRDGGRWIVVAGGRIEGKGTGRGLEVWDLIKGDVAWSLPTFPVASLLTNASSSSFTILSPESNSTNITTFHPSSHTPTTKSYIDLHVISPVYASASSNRHQEILALDNKGKPIRFGPELSVMRKEVRSLREEGGEREGGVKIELGLGGGMSIWEEMFGRGVFDVKTGGIGAVVNEEDEEELEEMQVDDKDDEQDMKTSSTDNKPLLPRTSTLKRSKYSKAFDGPAHTLPPTSILFDSFLQDFLAPDRERLGLEKSRVKREGDGAEEVGVKWKDEAEDVEEKKVKVEVGDGAERKGRVVGEEEVKRLTGLFKELLGDGGSAKAIAPRAMEIDANTSLSKTKKIKKRASVGGGSQAGVVNGNSNGEATTMMPKESPKVGQKRKEVSK